MGTCGAGAGHALARSDHGIEDRRHVVLDLLLRAVVRVRVRRQRRLHEVVAVLEAVEPCHHDSCCVIVALVARSILQLIKVLLIKFCIRLAKDGARD